MAAGMTSLFLEDLLLHKKPSAMGTDETRKPRQSCVCCTLYRASYRGLVPESRQFYEVKRHPETRRLSALSCYNLPISGCLETTEGSIDKRFIRTNEKIRAREIRVIDDEGQQVGVMPPFEALKKAREKNMDLVEISPTAVPPVCRIMDFGKFLYQQEKREREAKKNQKVITVKEVKFRINVDDHDYETKKNHVLRFLDEGDKVKATIFFRGREMTRTGLGRQILERLLKDVEGHSIVEFRPRQEGNTLHAILAPKKAAGEKHEKSEKPRAAALASTVQAADTKPAAQG
jgi:translation initiation factor IF-3